MKCLVAQTAGFAVCGFPMVAGASCGSQTRRSALHLQNRGNKARMCMKTKDSVNKSRSRRVKEPRSGKSGDGVICRASGATAVGSSTFRLLDLSSQKSAEQSENVYENKAQVQKATALRDLKGEPRGHRWTIYPKRARLPANRSVPRKKRASQMSGEDQLALF